MLGHVYLLAGGWARLLVGSVWPRLLLGWSFARLHAELDWVTRAVFFWRLGLDTFTRWLGLGAFTFRLGLGTCICYSWNRAGVLLSLELGAFTFWRVCAGLLVLGLRTFTFRLALGTCTFGTELGHLYFLAELGRV